MIDLDIDIECYCPWPQYSLLNIHVQTICGIFIWLWPKNLCTQTWLRHYKDVFEYQKYSYNPDKCWLWTYVVKINQKMSVQSYGVFPLPETDSYTETDANGFNINMQNCFHWTYTESFACTGPMSMGTVPILPPTSVHSSVSESESGSGNAPL